MTTSTLENGILRGFTHSIEGDISTLTVGLLENREIAMEAANAARDVMQNRRVKKTLIIIKKEAKPLSGPARIFSSELGTLNLDHLLASGIVVPSMPVMIIAKRLAKKTKADQQFFMEEDIATSWISAWKSKEQSAQWLNENAK